MAAGGSASSADILYTWSVVNTWWYLTGYWFPVMLQMFYTMGADNWRYLDHERKTKFPLHVMYLQVIAGIGGIFWHTYMANDLSLWYIKTQFEDGREEEIAKNNLFNSRVSVGTDARVQYERTGPRHFKAE